MIGLIFAAAVAAAASGRFTVPPNSSVMVIMSGTSTTMTPVRRVERGEMALVEDPPCGTPEASKAATCTKWMIEHPTLFQHSDGTIERMDRATVIPSVGAPRTVMTQHGDPYLNIGNGQALMMSAGRCSYSTGWHGKFYADQDFTVLGVPKLGAKPC